MANTNDESFRLVLDAVLCCAPRCVSVSPGPLVIQIGSETPSDAIEHRSEKRDRTESIATMGNDKTPTKEPTFDPDGTLGIARGNLAKDAKKQQKELRKQAEERASAFLPGAQERRKVLSKDDANPNLSALTPKQQRALNNRKSRKDKQLVTKLRRLETKQLSAAIAAADAVEILQTDQAGMLEAENDMEQTRKLTQLELKRKYLDTETARNIFDLELPASAPYGLEYDRSGRYGLLYGHKGHLALMDNSQKSLVTEFYLQERIRDACFLHNFTLFAVAQKNHAFIYDHTGAEVHRLGDHNDPMALQFLPYHWLLASVGRAGWLKYQDTTTGQLVSQHRTQMGACSVLRQNPSNAVLHAGHSNGTVTLWSPASSRYLVKMLCHKGTPIHGIAVDPTGRTMATGAADGRIRIWDLRMYKERHNYYTLGGVPSSLDFSQRGMLAVGHAGHVTIWSPDAMLQKEKQQYMHHAMPSCGPVQTVRFRPFEDVCGIGHVRGISSIVVPGSGEPSVDTSEYNTNPMQDAKQRREEEVRALLDKLQPNMIALDPDQVGGIEESDPHKRLERIQAEQAEINAADKGGKKGKTKKRGRSKIQTKLRRKRANIVDQNTIKLRQAREEEKAIKSAETGHSEPVEKLEDKAPSALKRFFK